MRGNIRSNNEPQLMVDLLWVITPELFFDEQKSPFNWNRWKFRLKKTNCKFLNSVKFFNVIDKKGAQHLIRTKFPAKSQKLKEGLLSDTLNLMARFMLQFHLIMETRDWKFIRHKFKWCKIMVLPVGWMVFMSGLWKLSLNGANLSEIKKLRTSRF